MLKKIGYGLAIILLLLGIAGAVGVKLFNDMWFKERANHLTFTYDNHPIAFDWAEGMYGGHFEPHAAIMIPLKFEGVSNSFYLQYDTGAHSTMIYGKSIGALRDAGLDIQEIVIDEKTYISSMAMTLGGSKVKMNTIQVLDNYGNHFDNSDTLSPIKLGTIGADFMEDRVVSIDFRQQLITLYNDRPEWMDSLPHFTPFDFKGRRVMLPASIKGENFDLFFDTGCSSFGLLTSKSRFDKYTDKNEREIYFDGNRFGESLPIHHKSSDWSFIIGSATLDLKRISYVDMYANYQRLMTPFTRIGGWLGNKPFTESVLILDTRKEEFIVLN